MKFLTAAVTLFSLASTVLAYEASTVPCIMWSPKDYIVNTFKTNSQTVITKSDAVSTIMSSLSADICSAKMIALVNQPEIETNSLARHGYEEAFIQLKELSSEATSRSQIRYISHGVDVNQVAKAIARQCDASVATLDPYTISKEDISGNNTPVIAIVPLPAAHDDVDILKANDALLGQLIEVVEEAVQDDYAIIYTSNSVKSTHTLKRRAPNTQDLPIFKKYQLFTPGVFMVLGVVFLFLFIAGTGISWLVGIQTPLRFEATPNKQKKQQ
ncbi:uncharacterized protein B0P05DRAFT_533449 [Gilbertella persicaria]|uniref:uncharacterized protein n=1 Tax=Gilbertella persicaria TaxID=101096 RepID=UPI002220D122|nr:uncharacterized protein B0P05DRAFT_533449 [Gilbertella persicaria]KAI8087036.1 hypothetical protein B0P05DRAFT_533449 [Gilbertella persicaria]